MGWGGGGGTLESGTLGQDPKEEVDFDQILQGWGEAAWRRRRDEESWGCLPLIFWCGVSVSKATREGDSSALGPWANASLEWELEGSPCLS